jgi:hypothetical protein
MTNGPRHKITKLDGLNPKLGLLKNFGCENRPPMRPETILFFFSIFFSEEKEKEGIRVKKANVYILHPLTVVGFEI